MDNESAISYVYAKASGILSKSFYGTKANILFQCNSLKELWNLVFKDEFPNISEDLLAQKIEDKCKDNFKKTFFTLANCFEKKTDLLLCIMNRLSENTQNGLSYAKELFLYCEKLNKKDKLIAKTLIQENLIMQNIVFALRLKVFYKMSKNDIIKELAFVSNDFSCNDPLVKEAICALDKSVDLRQDWNGWKYEKYLNTTDNDYWTVDPIWLQNSYNIYLLKMAIKVFRENPFSPMMLIAFYIIKQQELNYIRAAVESLRLSVNDNERLVWQKQHL